MEDVSPSATQLLRHGPAFGKKFRAMGCEVGIWIVTSDAWQAGPWLEQAQAWLWEAEATLSRFRPESELSQLNLQKQLAVSPLLWDVVRWALWAARWTGGLVDPTILPALEAAGYVTSFEKLPKHTSADAKGPAQVAGWRAVQLWPAKRQIQLRDGAHLDLGGVAKGYAARQLTRLLAPLGPCLVDIGGDIATWGPFPGMPGWPVAVDHPHYSQTDLAMLWLNGEAVATSGIDYRRWWKNGREFHHIIDPRTGLPAKTDLLSVTVVARSAVVAEAAAKAALILGSRRGLRWLETRGLVGIAVGRDGQIYTTRPWQRWLKEGKAQWTIAAN